jgi:P27 family predicted phage terminase small subunit
MQKLPASRKQLSGTNRPDKDRQGVRPGEALTEAPPPPESLSEIARAAWEELAAETVAIGVLTSADMAMLALLAETSATVSELEHTIRSEGFTVSTGAGGQKAHPALKALETTRGAVTRLLKEFGLSPLSRKFVEKAPASRDDEDKGGFQTVPRITDAEMKVIQARNRQRLKDEGRL